MFIKFNLKNSVYFGFAFDCLLNNSCLYNNYKRTVHYTVKFNALKPFKHFTNAFITMHKYFTGP